MLQLYFEVTIYQVDGQQKADFKRIAQPRRDVAFTDFSSPDPSVSAVLYWVNGEPNRRLQRAAWRHVLRAVIRLAETAPQVRELIYPTGLQDNNVQQPEA
jgi:hypothetical protein